MAHDQFLRARVALVISGTWKDHVRAASMRFRTRKKGRRVTRTDHMARQRLSVEVMRLMCIRLTREQLLERYPPVGDG